MAITLQVQLSSNEPKMRSCLSDYLTHWTGKYRNPILNSYLTRMLGREVQLKQDTTNADEKKGFDNLTAILSKNQLWLNPNPHFMNTNHLGMTCFTDIPLHLSSEHCRRYGKFGIVFKKSSLIAYGANPVLYLTNKNIMSNVEKVYNFICDAIPGKTLDDEVLKSLQKFFGFVQDYEHKTETGTDTYYYEREWRILQNNLEYCKEGIIPPGKCGSFPISHEDDEDQYYFQFQPDDVAFLICPKDWAKEVNELPAVKVNNYTVQIYEDMVL